MIAIDKQNNMHITPPQTHIAFVMTRPKGIGSRHKSVTGNNHGRQRTTPCDNRCFDSNYSHSNSNFFSLTVIYVYLPLNNSVINPSQLSLVRQQSSSSSDFTPRDNRCFNSKESNFMRDEFPSLVMPVPPSLNYSVINSTHMSSVNQQSFRFSHNTTQELQASSISGRTSPDPSNTMPPPSTNNISSNIYGCMVDVSELTPAQ